MNILLGIFVGIFVFTLLYSLIAFVFTIIFYKAGFGSGGSWLSRDDYKFYAGMWFVFVWVFIVYSAVNMASKLVDK